MSGGNPTSGNPTSGDAASDDIAGLGYAEALAELERILDELEGDAVDVDVLAVRVRRAAALVRLCRQRVLAARLEIEAVVSELDDAAG
jgi:exodeoxyribonuclease VII small subunit